MDCDLAVCAALALFVKEVKAEWTIGLEKSWQRTPEAQVVSFWRISFAADIVEKTLRECIVVQARL